MKTKTLLIAAAVSLLGVAASERTYMGHRVIEMQFPIAEGKKVSLPMTDAGPIPAEDKNFKVEAAGVSLQPMFLSPKNANLTWGFALTAKASQNLERVTVQEVHPSEVAKAFVDDQSPALKGQVWSGSAVGVEPNPNSTAWLFQDGSSIFVFRFTIKPVGKRAVVLYQPVRFSQPAKEALRMTIRQITGS
ncbi:MAG TPA: hypothetical protein VN493_20990 [Thermoanaerobaculia bacterium]|nr:hypothetical protein [Thermoanaerobaculia bacterium]